MLLESLILARESHVSPESSEAIVLRGVDFSETSRIVTFLSPMRGRLACMAQGVKRPKSQLAALLDTFNRVELVYYWKDGRSVQRLSEASLLDGYPAIKRDLEKAAFAAFPLEIASKVAHENEPSAELYAALARGLDSLGGWNGSVRTHVCWQALQLLSASGFEPSLGACVDCGSDVDRAPGFAYRGGVTCPQCAPDRRLSEEGFKALCALVASRERCPAAPGDEAFDVVRRYAAHQLMAPFQSVRVLDQMFSPAGNSGK